MANLISPQSRPLPETLLEDLQKLTARDNNSFLTWCRLGAEPAGGEAPWFTVDYHSDGRRFGLRLAFWIPAWMNARGVAAILPARLLVTECDPGHQAEVDLGLERRSALLARLPAVARTCARLINELWGPTESEAVLLRVLDYAVEALPTPFPELEAYGE